MRRIFIVCGLIVVVLVVVLVLVLQEGGVDFRQPLSPAVGAPSGQSGEASGSSLDISTTPFVADGQVPPEHEGLRSAGYASVDVVLPFSVSAGDYRHSQVVEGKLRGPGVEGVYLPREGAGEVGVSGRTLRGLFRALEGSVNKGGELSVSFSVVVLGSGLGSHLIVWDGSGEWDKSAESPTVVLGSPPVFSTAIVSDLDEPYASSPVEIRIDAGGRGAWCTVEGFFRSDGALRVVTNIRKLYVYSYAVVRVSAEKRLVYAHLSGTGNMGAYVYKAPPIMRLSLALGGIKSPDVKSSEEQSIVAYSSILYSVNLSGWPRPIADYSTEGAGGASGRWVPRWGSAKHVSPDHSYGIVVAAPFHEVARFRFNRIEDVPAVVRLSPGKFICEIGVTASGAGNLPLPVAIEGNCDMSLVEGGRARLVTLKGLAYIAAGSSLRVPMHEAGWIKHGRVELDTSVLASSVGSACGKAEGSRNRGQYVVAAFGRDSMTQVDRSGEAGVERVDLHCGQVSVAGPNGKEVLLRTLSECGGIIKYERSNLTGLRVR